MSRNEGFQDSEIDWIGMIPSHWRVIRLKYLTTPRKVLSADGSEELLSVTESRGIVKRKELKSVDENLSRSEDLTGYRIVRQGDLVNNIMLVWKRGLGVSPYDGIVSPAYSVFSFKDICCPKYFNYLLRSDEYTTEFRRNSTGITMSRLRLYDDSFGSVYSHLPPTDEQKLISRYLDKKTDQIDRLVEKIQKKIELLKEQRTSLINHYVTKGLDPNVEMKDSGVEWIGKIPKHWGMKKLKHVVRRDGFRSGPFGSTLITNQLSHSGDWIVYSPENLRSDSVLEQLYVPQERKEELEKYLVNKDDIILPIVGSLNVSKVITETDRLGIINQRLCRLSLDPEKVNIPYISFLFKYSHLIQTQIELEKKGSILDHITKEIIFNFLFPTPLEKIERDQLFDRVINVNDKFDTLINRNNSKIKLLKEYRQSLISSAVTGKVRITEDMV